MFWGLRLSTSSCFVDFVAEPLEVEAARSRPVVVATESMAALQSASPSSSPLLLAPLFCRRAPPIPRRSDFPDPETWVWVFGRNYGSTGGRLGLRMASGSNLNAAHARSNEYLKDIKRSLFFLKFNCYFHAFSFNFTAITELSSSNCQ